MCCKRCYKSLASRWRCSCKVLGGRGPRGMPVIVRWCMHYLCLKHLGPQMMSDVDGEEVNQCVGKVQRSRLVHSAGCNFLLHPSDLSSCTCIAVNS